MRPRTSQSHAVRQIVQSVAEDNEAVEVEGEANLDHRVQHHQKAHHRNNDKLLLRVPAVYSVCAISGFIIKYKKSRNIFSRTTATAPR